MPTSPDEFTVPGPYHTMGEIGLAAKRSTHSRFWFSEDTMSFFNCQLESDPVAGRFFITSEGEPSIGIRRAYTIRVCDDNGEISTVLMDAAHKGEHTGDGFMGFATLTAAEATIFKYVEKRRVATDAVKKEHTS